MCKTCIQAVLACDCSVTYACDNQVAVQILPELADVWKRRSQARAALGNVAGATKDLQDCLRSCDSPCMRSAADHAAQPRLLSSCAHSICPTVGNCMYL